MPSKLQYIILLLFCFGKAQGIEQQLPVPFLQGDEYLKFKITYLGIVGGYSTLEVKHGTNNNGKAVIHLHLKAWTTPFVSIFYTLKLNLHSIVEKESLKSIYYTEDKLEKKRVYQHKIIVYPPENRFNFYDNLVRTNANATIFYTNRGYDVVASFYLSRCVDFFNNTNLKFDSFFRDRIYQTTVLNLGEKLIRHKWGKEKARMIVPKMQFRGLFINKGDIIIYLSQDEYRIPLLMVSKLAVGDFRAILIERKLPNIKKPSTTENDS